MKKRASKYDGFLFYSERKDKIVYAIWDYSWGGVSQYFITDGLKSWYSRGRLKIPRGYSLVTRLDERYCR